MQLQPIGLQMGDHGLQILIRGVDRQSNLAGPPCNLLAQTAGFIEAEMARAGGKKHKAHLIGAKAQGSLKALRRAQAADFDQTGIFWQSSIIHALL